MQKVNEAKTVAVKRNEIGLRVDKVKGKGGGLISSSRSRVYTERISPGPGSYSPVGLDSSPQVSFPKSLRRSIVARDKSPGPGEYQLNCVVSNGPKYTMASRSSNNRFSPTPGPGSYDPMHETSLERFPSVRIGRSKRVFHTESSGLGPGPASYSMDLSTMSGPKWRFTTSSRQASLENQIPGPGAYQISSLKSGIAYTISLSKKAMKYNDSPGPGSYLIEKRESSPSALIGSSERHRNSKSFTPGPGAYNVDIEKHRQSSIFGTSRREDAKISPSPGPGNYKIPCSLGRGPRYSIRSKLPLIKQLITPGPGSYNTEKQKLLENEPKWTIPSTGRESPPSGY